MHCIARFQASEENYGKLPRSSRLGLVPSVKDGHPNAEITLSEGDEWYPKIRIGLGSPREAQYEMDYAQQRES
jgi:hypothetical protein